MKSQIEASSRSAAMRAGFTLLEVMIASGILFICLFAILGLLANTLRNARALQRAPVDAGMLAAELSLTNKLAESTESGDFKSFGEAYSDYHWNREIFEAETNGLFAVDFVVYRKGNARSPESHMTILLFRPESPGPVGRVR
jgi:Tfp pilus assembly protein PilV